MSKREISVRFDEIVDFSGCAKYIDTPVKRYSSGMHVRLAFAVAAHLETDILIVDEVLAVGDAEFQARCIGKMKDLGTAGHRTVLFVSHNMASMRQLCPRAILMDKGMVVARGETGAMIEEYMTMGSAAGRSMTWSEEDAPLGKGVKLYGIRISDSNGNTNTGLTSGESIIVEIEYQLLADLRNIRVGISLTNSEGALLFVSSDYSSEGSENRSSPGFYVSRGIIPGNMLVQGHYSVEVHFEVPRTEELLRGVHCSFEILEQTHQYWGPIRNQRVPGLIHPKVFWSVTRYDRDRHAAGTAELSP